jgi:SAM-dependent methyltransferase
VDHHDHVGLLRDGVRPDGVRPDGAPRDGAAPVPPTWADIGAGTGAFTLALADLLGPGARIVAVDRDRGALAQTTRAIAERFPATTFETLVGDLTAPLGLPPLDGLVAANSLHFVARDRQVDVVRQLATHLRPGGAFLVVEYDADRGNPWVPHPFSWSSWQRMAADAGVVDTRAIGRVPSRFLGAIYSAASRVPGRPDSAPDRRDSASANRS